MANNAKIFGIIALSGILITLLFKKMRTVNLIAKFEGLKLTAYQDQGGVWTIGYGNTFNPFTNERVKEGDVISQAEAMRWLVESVSQFKKGVTSLIRVPQTPNQIAALTSLAFNIGLQAFRTSTLLRLVNQGAPAQDIAAQFMRWNRIKGVVSRGLTNRRREESTIYLS